jgi:hypothetical protein
MYSRFALTVLLLVSLPAGCATGGSAGRSKPQPIVIPGGTISPMHAIGFDATYDPELDKIVPGYKILNVAFTNNSMDIFPMDPMSDSWTVIDRRGKKIKTVINLRDKDPDVWAKLAHKIRMLIEYPLLIPVGTTVPIDLLVDAKANLNEFKQVTFASAGKRQSYIILPREE